MISLDPLLKSPPNVAVVACASPKSPSLASPTLSTTPIIQTKFVETQRPSLANQDVCEFDVSMNLGHK